jgi:hypothetical protein
MFYENEIDIPFDVLSIDDYSYLVPHGLPLEVEPLISSGVGNVMITNRNVTVAPVDSWSRKKTFDSHPVLPVDEYLTITGTNDTVTRYSIRLLDMLGMTIDSLYDFYSISDKRLMDLDPSQLSISGGKLLIGEIPSEKMVVVWSGTDFVAAPASAKLAGHEEAVEEIEGALTGGRFRCKYGMLEIRKH